MDPAFAVLSTDFARRRARCDQEVRVCQSLIEAGEGPVVPEKLYRLVHTFAADPRKSLMTPATTLAVSAALKKKGREVPPEMIHKLVHVRGVLEEGRVGKGTEFAVKVVDQLRTHRGHRLRLADLVIALVPEFPLIAPRHLLALVAENQLVGRGEFQLTVERTPTGRPLVRLSLRAVRPVGGEPLATTAAIDGGVGAVVSTPPPPTSLWATLSDAISSVGSSVGLW